MILTTSSSSRSSNSNAVTRLVRRFLSTLEGARRFHQGEAVAPGSDPRRCFAHFLSLIHEGDLGALEKHYGPEVFKTAMSAQTGTLGGFLVPTELREDLYRDVAEEAVVRPRATVVPMTSGELLLPLPDATTARTAGTAAHFGGILLQWYAEASTRPETAEPSWKMVRLVAHELTGYALISNPMIADARQPTLDDFLRRLFARSLAFYEDLAFLTGTGVGKPLGMLHSGSRLTVTRASATDFKHADANAMIGKLLPSSWPRAVWVMHPLALAKMADIGSTTTTTWQANMPSQSGDMPTGAVGALHGRPVFVSEKCPTLGTAGDVMLIDPSLYVIGDRSLEIAFSGEEPTAFLKGQGVWRIVARLGGQPYLNGPTAVTLQDASTTVSPYVVLV